VLPMRKLLSLFALTCAALPLSQVSAASQSALSFVDIRAQGGVTVNDAPTVNLTLMAGDIGNKNPHVLTMDADMGIVLGLRAQAADGVNVEYKGMGGDVDVVLGGGTVLGGLGFYLGKYSHAELVFGYARGVGSSTGDMPWDKRDTEYYQYLGEIGWYYMFDEGLQFGLTAGYSVIKAKVEQSNGVNEKADTHGVDAGLALGIRF
jgi:hypothetical protein